MSHVATRGAEGGGAFSYFFKMCFYSSAKVPTPSLRKHIRKRGCVHVIFLDGERQKAGEGRGRGPRSLSNFMLCSPAKVKARAK